MDKQMIEEMAQCKNEYGFICCDCVYRKSCERYSLAEELYNAGYRKIPEGSVVLTREEHQKYLAFKLIEPQVRGCLDRERELEKRLETAIKETAEKFAERLKLSLDKNDLYVYSNDDIDEICKEITEGKNE